MEALARFYEGTKIVELPKPRVHAQEVLVEVKAAGICRTDLMVHRGETSVADGMVLGHECSGIVAGKGSMVEDDLALGQRVCVNPILACGDCRGCHIGEGCGHFRQLGVHRPGVFAQFVAVPRSAVYAIPPSMSDLEGAYVEPVAATLGVLAPGIQLKGAGALVGAGRIADLTAMVLGASGVSFKRVSTGDLKTGPSDVYDFVIEAEDCQKAMADLQRSLKFRGVLILKSRLKTTLQFIPALWINKEITVHFAGYGSFQDAIQWINSKRLDLTPMMGECVPLERWRQLFDLAGANEERKHFFVF